MRQFLLTLAMLPCAAGLISATSLYLEHMARSAASSLSPGSAATSAAKEQTVIFANGERYVGELREGLRSGQGTYTWPDGRMYSGEFRTGQPDGHGIYLLANGEKYEGEFQNNRRTGAGTYHWPDGRKYVGQFLEDQPNGQGIHTWSDGTKFAGPFRSGRPNGKGILSHADGRRQAAEFRDGELVGEEAAPPRAASGTEAREGGEIRIGARGTTYTIPVLVNNALALEFYFDTGAADVSIPGHIFEALKKAGSVRPEDILGAETYLMANGVSRKAVTFRIRSLKVGPSIVENVRGTVVENSAPLLLGMSFLSRFRSWSIDNQRQVLILN